MSIITTLKMGEGRRKRENKTNPSNRGRVEGGGFEK